MIGNSHSSPVTGLFGNMTCGNSASTTVPHSDAISATTSASATT
jgi:hypothetical protein